MAVARCCRNGPVKQMLPWLLVIFAVSVSRHLAGGPANPCLAGGVNDPVLHDGGGQRRIYPIVVAQALKPFPQATGRAAAQNTLQLGLCFLTSLLVSALIATPLLTTTSVMLSTVVLVGWVIMMQRCEEVG